MEIVLLGTGGAWPDADRNAPAFLVRHGIHNYLVDCGGGVCHQLMKVGVPPALLDYIFLTHTHIDHCVEFPSLVFGAYLTGKEGSFHLFGPQGTAHFSASLFDHTYDFAIPMMRKLRKKEISVISAEVEKGLVCRINEVTVEAVPVEHGFPTLAYRFSAGGKSVVFSGDTAVCDNLIEIGRNADVLVLECSFPEDAGAKPGHLIPSQVAQVARMCAPGLILLVHLFPPCKGKEKEILNEIGRLYDGKVEIGQDLQRFQIE